MKYANGTLYINQQQIHAFVCAKTKKRMLELLEQFHVTAHYFNGWWSECENDEIKTIANNQEGIWIIYDRFNGKWEKLEKK